MTSNSEAFGRIVDSLRNLYDELEKNGVELKSLGLANTEGLEKILEEVERELGAPRKVFKRETKEFICGVELKKE